MNKLIIGVLIITAIGIGAFLLKPDTAKAPDEIIVPSEPSAIKPQDINTIAYFTIITDDITRNFSNSKYHNRSEDVFITADNPTQIYVMQTGIKWSDFFATLPMKLSYDCLITGDSETLCDGKQGVLKFYLNDKEDKNLLDKEIKQDDRALIRFISY